MTKSELRDAMKAQRRTLTREEIADKSHSIFNTLLSVPDFINADTVMVYLSAFKEPDTSEITAMLYKNNKKIIVPISNTESCTITPSYLLSPDDLVKGAYGIYEPKECIPVKPSEIKLAIIPGIAFDVNKNRTGFGKGYYDRFLNEFNGTKIGICYDFQLIDSIPTDTYDIPMDIIITEKRLIK